MFKQSSSLQCPYCGILSHVGDFVEYPAQPWQRAKFKPWKGSKYDPAMQEDSTEEIDTSNPD